MLASVDITKKFARYELGLDEISHMIKWRSPHAREPSQGINQDYLFSLAPKILLPYCGVLAVNHNGVIHKIAI